MLSSCAKTSFCRFASSIHIFMFEAMLSSKLISADVCGTVMDSLSVQMAQVCVHHQFARLALPSVYV